MDTACCRRRRRKKAAATRKTGERTGGTCWEMARHGSKSDLQNSRYSLSVYEKELIWENTSQNARSIFGRSKLSSSIHSD